MTYDIRYVATHDAMRCGAHNSKNGKLSGPENDRHYWYLYRTISKLRMHADGWHQSISSMDLTKAFKRCNLSRRQSRFTSDFMVWHQSHQRYTRVFLMVEGQPIVDDSTTGTNHPPTHPSSIISDLTLNI